LIRLACQPASQPTSQPPSEPASEPSLASTNRSAPVTCIYYPLSPSRLHLLSAQPQSLASTIRSAPITCIYYLSPSHLHLLSTFPPAGQSRFLPSQPISPSCQPANLTFTLGRLKTQMRSLIAQRLLIVKIVAFAIHVCTSLVYMETPTGLLITKPWFCQPRVYEPGVQLPRLAPFTRDVKHPLMNSIKQLMNTDV
jgi:hypothetical protein